MMNIIIIVLLFLAGLEALVLMLFVLLYVVFMHIAMLM